MPGYLPRGSRRDPPLRGNLLCRQNRAARYLGALCLTVWLWIGAAGGNCRAGSSANAADFQFCVVSDLHFNPFSCSNQAYTNLCQDLSDINWSDTFAAYEAGTRKTAAAYDRAGKDSSYRLIQSALSALTNRCPRAAFVLCLGDVFVHESEIEKALAGSPEQHARFQANREAYVLGAEGMVAQMFRRVGLTNVYPVLGNNDSIRDYHEPSSHFLQGYARAWAVCVPAGILAGPFSELGCYRARLPGFANVQLLAINSSLFSADPHHLSDPRLNGFTNAGATVAWLRYTLTSSSGNLLACHIPPGIDFHHSTNESVVSFWEKNFTSAVLNLFAARRESITGWFSAHTHNDEFRLIYSRPGPFPIGCIHVAPSISPIHRNRPAFQVFTAEPAGRMVDYQTFVLKNMARLTARAWKREYSFSSFSRDGYNEQTLHHLFDSSGSGPNRARFAQFYAAGGDVPSIAGSDLYWRSTTLEAGSAP